MRKDIGDKKGNCLDPSKNMLSKEGITVTYKCVDDKALTEPDHVSIPKPPTKFPFTIDTDCSWADDTKDSMRCTTG